MTQPSVKATPRRRSRFRNVAILATVTALAGTGTVVTWTMADAADIDTGAYYQLTAAHSGKVLDVEQRLTASGARLVQNQSHGGTSQHFQFVAVSGGWHQIRVRHSGQMLDVLEQSLVDGASVVQYTDNKGPNQQFKIVTASNGNVRLVNRHSGKALDVADASTADGAPVIQWTDHGGANQQWRLTKVGTGTPPVDPGPTATPTPDPKPPTDPNPPTDPEPPATAGGRQVENLDRGLISVRSGNGNLVSWRLLGTEATNTGFNLYRAGAKVNAAPITNSTNFLDNGAAANAAYTVRAVVNGAEQAASEQSLRFTGGNYLDVPIQSPGGDYIAVEASPGDLDGDGQLDLVVKWDPANAKDNSQGGVTGNVFIDGYRLDGTRLWRIDLGRNIRAGAHYTQFQVYDYDGDGRAEVAMKTGDGTRDARGTVIGDTNADHRNASGYVLKGPEFLTMFSGTSGAALSTVDYDPPRGNVGAWGDTYGNRVDRFLAGTAYLDGQRPSVIMARGYYTRAVVAAWDFRDGKLVKRWTYDSVSTTQGAGGMGNHQLSIADADGDGRDEIMYGSAAIDDNGKLLWRNGTHHGDAYHVGDLDPARPGLEIFKPSEHGGAPAAWFGDAKTGRILWQNPVCNCDNGRGVSADIYEGSPGAESWSATVDGMFNTQGRNVGRKPGSMNFLAWWDGDATRELLDRNQINKYGTNGDARLLTAPGVMQSNGTKATPALSGDLLGDWREEVIWRTTDNRALRIFATPIPTSLRIPTLLHDTQYRVALAWQNTAYNQPPHPSFFIGTGMAAVSQPKVYAR